MSEKPGDRVEAYEPSRWLWNVGADRKTALIVRLVVNSWRM